MSAVVYSKSQGVEYRTTAEDRIWAARMVVGEGPTEAAEVLWSMTQRFVFLAGQDIRAKRKIRFPTLAAMFRAYSQPINPKWGRQGSACSGQWRGKEPCSENRLKRRERLWRASWAELKARGPKEAAALEVVNKFFAGSLKNPVPGAVDFAVPGLVKRAVARHAQRHPSLAGNNSPLYRHKGGNWFIAHPNTLKWNRATVMVYTSASGWKSMATTAATIAGAVALGYYLS